MDLLNGLKDATNYTITENGALSHKTTRSDLFDMFAFGGAYRQRSVEDCILLFKKAYIENPVYALKCLFYLRDVREGQGERRFFKTCMNWLANQDKEAALRNLDYVSEYGRYDDLYCFVGTKVEKEMFDLIKKQVELDINCKTPSLLAKWLKSENASSYKTKVLGNKTRDALGLTHKQYRKVLATLRTRINVLEKLMSENRWDEIEFDKIPSKAGLIYRNAFARRDVIKQKYTDFVKSEKTTVNAGTLYPYDVVRKAIDCMEVGYGYKSKNCALDDVNRIAINKYWDNLTDYFNGATLNALCVVDTSGSMTWGSGVKPIDVAISLGLYTAERAKGPFHNHFISFSRFPKLIETEGVDFCDKVDRIYKQNLCDNTNIEATFDLILATAIDNHLSQDDMPNSIIVISDMEFDMARGDYFNSTIESSLTRANTLMESMADKWTKYGYTLPNMIFWNVNARHDLIPMLDGGRVSFVSGCSPVIFEQILKGKTGYDLMMDKLSSDRYAVIG